MSALYWNFVSQKVNNVRGDFDKIVNKESEFQNVMYNFTSRAPMTWQVKSNGKKT